MLQDAAKTMTAAVAETLDALGLKDEDAAAKRLAQRYAEVIDQAADAEGAAWSARWIGPLLLDALEQLGATPAARARLKGGKPGDAPVSQLGKLRAARRA